MGRRLNFARIPDVVSSSPRALLNSWARPVHRLDTPSPSFPPTSTRPTPPLLRSSEPQHVGIHEKAAKRQCCKSSAAVRGEPALLSGEPALIRSPSPPAWDLVATFAKRNLQGASTATKDPALKSKKDEPPQELTPLEKMLQNAGPLRADGSDKFFGLENVRQPPVDYPTWAQVLTRCFFSLGTHGTAISPRVVGHELCALIVGQLL